MSVKTTVLRTLSEEEQVRFEGEFESAADAEAVVDSQLALLRRHMIELNERVRKIDEEKSVALTAELAAKGEELKRLDREIEARQSDLGKLDKKLRRVG